VRVTSPASILTARCLSAKRSWRTVFSGLDLDVSVGDRIYVRGENGSGKSTLLQTLIGIHPRKTGDLLWRGRPLATARESLFTGGLIAYLPQYCNIFPSLTLRENILLGCHTDPVSTQSRLKAIQVSLPELTDVIDSLPKQASAGQRQLAAFVRMLVRQPLLLILDEPTAGVAADLVPTIYALAAQYHAAAAVIFTEQHSEIAATWATRQFTISAGHIAEDQLNAQTP